MVIQIGVIGKFDRIAAGIVWSYYSRATNFLWLDSPNDSAIKLMTWKQIYDLHKDKQYLKSLTTDNNDGSSYIDIANLTWFSLGEKLPETELCIGDNFEVSPQQFPSKGDTQAKIVFLNQVLQHVLALDYVLLLKKMQYNRIMEKCGEIQHRLLQTIAIILNLKSIITLQGIQYNLHIWKDVTVRWRCNV